VFDPESGCRHRNSQGRRLRRRAHRHARHPHPRPAEASHFETRSILGASRDGPRASVASGLEDSAATRRCCSAPQDRPVRASTIGRAPGPSATLFGPAASWRALRSENGPKMQTAAAMEAAPAVIPRKMRGSTGLRQKPRISMFDFAALSSNELSDSEVRWGDMRVMVFPLDGARWMNEKEVTCRKLRGKSTMTELTSDFFTNESALGEGALGMRVPFSNPCALGRIIDCDRRSQEPARDEAPSTQRALAIVVAVGAVTSAVFIQTERVASTLIAQSCTWAMSSW
jgi:hypothetical protein